MSKTTTTQTAVEAARANLAKQNGYSRNQRAINAAETRLRNALAANLGEAVALVVADRRESYVDMTPSEAVTHARNVIVVGDLDPIGTDALSDAYRTVLSASEADLHEVFYNTDTETNPAKIARDRFRAITWVSEHVSANEAEIVADGGTDIGGVLELAEGMLGLSEDDYAPMGAFWTGIATYFEAVIAALLAPEFDLIPVSTDDGENVFDAALVESGRWNGFAVCWFTTAEATRIVAMIEAQGGMGDGAHFEFSADSGSFAEVTEDGDRMPVVFRTENGIRLHRIGDGWMWEEFYGEPTEAEIATAIMLGREQITADIAEGRVPAEIASFEGLHDFTDANEYGGLCDDMRWVNSDHAAQDVQDALDAWLRAGRPPVGALIASNVTAENPWYYTLPSNDSGHWAQMWERSLHPATNGQFIQTGFGPTFPTSEQARAWAVRFITRADGTPRGVTVIEVI